VAGLRSAKASAGGLGTALRRLPLWQRDPKGATVSNGSSGAASSTSGPFIA
ncbi:unnamed protein product, partial [Polarella glacialis]